MTKDVVGFEGLYTVDDKGEVFSLRSGKYLTPFVIEGKYKYVHLCNGKKTKLKRLHRVVAEAFIPNPNNLPQVNHIDGDKLNCAVVNLEWCSPKENIHHAIKHGLFNPVGENNPAAKLTRKQVEQIRAEYVPQNRAYSTNALGKKYGVSNVMIGKIVRKECWKENGACKGPWEVTS